MMMPYASTNTVLWEKMAGKRNKIPMHIAGLMLAGILSDTLKFTSVTSTDRDKQAAQQLAKIAGVHIDQFAAEMFNAKSDISDLSPREVLLVDSKDYQIGNKTYKIAVLETTNPENVIAIKEAIKVEMTKLEQEEKIDGAFFFVVDILNTGSELIIQDDEVKHVAIKAFGEEADGDIMHLPGIVSRKKQMVPNLMAAIA
jgi:manganese-dependent inorganic pyrophosphatase